MTENPPPSRADGPDSGGDYPPYPGGSGQQPPPGSPPGQYRPPGGAQYGPPGSRYGPSGGAQYGPPQGGYGSPGGSQYGPPPGGGYGPPPEYGMPGGYPPPGNAGAPAHGGAGFARPPLLSVGDALSYGWARFSKNALNWILLLLAMIVALAVVVGILIAVLVVPSASSSSDSTLAVSFFSIGMIVFLLAVLALAFLWSVVTTQGGLREVDGTKPAVGDFFRFQNLGGALLAAVLLGVLVWLGSLLCYLPGLVVAFFGMFTVPFAIDKGMNAWTALQSSFALVSANIGPLLLLYLAVTALNWVGSIALGVGLFITLPMTTIALMFAFRRLTGGPIAPVASGY